MNKPDWISEAFFYHIYPLGLCNAPAQNDFSPPPVNRLAILQEWIPHLKSLGVNAVYLGPILESISHGYDTVDYQNVDRRLGSNEDFANLVDVFHQNGIRVILDAVFNHVGRQFPAFLDVQQRGQSSEYQGWFSGLDFSQPSPMGDPFTYHTWDGQYNLVKLNLQNPAVCSLLLNAAQSWFRNWHIDGLRLDAIDQLDLDFLRQLHQAVLACSPEAWLMGEAVHGDYTIWANPEMVHSITNYECYKGLYSSHNDQNLFEIAYALNRQSGSSGLYRHLSLYNFVDNHDVTRIASILNRPEYLNTLYILLFTIPGVPSLYYGSEWGMPGEKGAYSDQALRPALDIHHAQTHPNRPDLLPFLQHLSAIRQTHAALKWGDYQELWVQNKQFAFLRNTGEEQILVAINIADEPAHLSLQVPLYGKTWADLLHANQQWNTDANTLALDVPPYTGRILRATD